MNECKKDGREGGRMDGRNELTKKDGREERRKEQEKDGREGK